MHAACIRLQFNAFHTSARYQQKNKLCPFCANCNSEDRLEHIFQCTEIKKLFHPLWRQSLTSRFFFLKGDKEEMIAMSYGIYALYTIHNDLRHDDRPGMIPLPMRWTRVFIDIKLGKHAKSVLHLLHGHFRQNGNIGTTVDYRSNLSHMHCSPVKHR